MTKKELIKKVASTQGVTVTQAEAIINAFIKELFGSICNGLTITLRGVGRFDSAVRSARVGRNPRTGQSVVIPAHISPTFKPSKELIDEINKKLSFSSVQNKK